MFVLFPWRSIITGYYCCTCYSTCHMDHSPWYSYEVICTSYRSCGSGSLCSSSRSIIKHHHQTSIIKHQTSNTRLFRFKSNSLLQQRQWYIPRAENKHQQQQQQQQGSPREPLRWLDVVHTYNIIVVHETHTSRDPQQYRVSARTHICTEVCTYVLVQVQEHRVSCFRSTWRVYDTRQSSRIPGILYELRGIGTIYR